jgi:sortase A
MRTRWGLLVATVTLLGGCSSAAPKVAAPEPPPATAAVEAPAAEVAPPITEATAAVPEVAPPPTAAAPAPAAAPAAAPADDDPILEGATRPAAPARTAAPAAAPAAGSVQAASAKPSGKPTPTGRIEIPSIGLNHATYEGIDLGTLQYGPGHWPGTPLPGNRGNTVFPGHRTTNTRPFWDIDRIAIGNEVIFTTPAGRFTYRVTETLIVGSRDTWVVSQTPDATFTILACHPKGSAKQRYVVKGKLVSAGATTQPGASAGSGAGSSSGSGMPVLTTTTTRRGFLGLF